MHLAKWMTALEHRTSDCSAPGHNFRPNLRLLKSAKCTRLTRFLEFTMAVRMILSLLKPVPNSVKYST